jgi:signal transduction histidine kinase/CheY-like chemotaxis protein
METAMSVTKHLKRLPKGLLLGFLLLAVLVGGLGYYHHHRQLERVKNDRQRDLSGIAAEKAHYVSAWRSQQYLDGRSLAGDVTLRRISNAYFHHDRDAQAGREMRRWLESLADNHHYRGVLLLDDSGNGALAAAKGYAPPGSPVAGDVKRAFSSRDVLFTSPHFSSADGKPHFGMIVPLFDADDVSLPIGALYIRIDPEGFLFPLVQRHPMVSRSTETLLVGPVGGQHFYLSKPRFWPEGRLRRITAHDRERIRTAESLGEAPYTYEGKDYRGATIIAAIHRVPGTSWHIIAKIDTDEVIAPLHRGTMIVLILSSLLIVAAGGLVAGLCHRKDVFLNRERDCAESKARNMAERFRKLYEEHNAILQAIPDVVLLLTTDQKILWANSVAESDLGLDSSLIIGRSCDDIWHARIGDGFLCPGRKCVSTGVLERSLGWTPDKRLYDIRAVPVRDTTGKIIHIVETGRDLTEFRQMEAQLRHSQKMEAVCQLAGGIVHDFNNVITAIIGFSYILQMKIPEYKPERAYLSQITSAAERAATLTGGLLSFSRKHTVVMRHIDLNQVVRSMEKLVAPLLEEDIALRVALHESSLTVYADRVLLGQVIVNLVTNARDAMPRGGVISIRTMIENGGAGKAALPDSCLSVCLEVEDSGVGMDADLLERVFEPFFTTKEEGKGTGLGLSIVHGIVKQHNGAVEVASEQGKGTLIRVCLPLSPGGEIEAPHPEALPLPGGNETVMIVEDDERIRRFLVDLLSGTGYRVIEARGGIEAQERYRGHADEVMLLICDIVIPEKNGKELHRELMKIRPDLKALFISGYTPDALRKRGIETDDMIIMSKPFKPRELLVTVRNLLD